MRKQFQRVKWNTRERERQRVVKRYYVLELTVFTQSNEIFGLQTSKQGQHQQQSFLSFTVLLG